MEDRMREKLIDTLSGYVSEPPCDTCKTPIGHCERCGIDRLADYLIANGVTIQKWIPVTERLPDEEGWYQVYTTPDKGYKSINKACFCKGFEWDNFTPEWHGAGGRWGNVTHWMPLPEAPKGE